MKNNDTTIDDFIIHPDSKNYSIITGRTFRKGPLLRGIGALLFGLLLFYGFILAVIHSSGAINLLILLFSLIFILAGSLILFAKEGVEIDANQKKVKEFMQFIGRYGKWQSIEKYPFITVIKENKTVYYGAYTGSLSSQWKYSSAKDNDEFEVCLLNKMHYKRIGIYFTKDYFDAKEKCDNLAKILGISYADFNPTRISERKSRSRKR